LFTQCGTEIDFGPAAPSAQWENVGIFASFFFSFGIGENEIGVAANIGSHLYQAASALSKRGTSKLAIEVEPPRPSRGEPPGDMDVLYGTHIALNPDLIVAV